MKTELVIEIHENGQTFIELDSLIAWFENDEIPGLKQMGEYAAYTLRQMKEKGLTNPTNVMTEDEYKKR